MQSYSFTNKRKNLIEFTPHFATLIDEIEEAYVFEFVFRVSRIAIANKSLSKVVIKCINQNVFIENNSNIQKLSAQPPKKKAIIAQQGKFEIENIQFKHVRQVKQAIAKSNSVIAEGVVNLYDYIDPEVARALQSGVHASQIEGMYSYLDSLELVNNRHTLYDSSNVDQGDIRKLNLELISNFLMHPIKVVNLQLDRTDYEIINSIRKYYMQDALQSLPRESAYYRSAKKRKFVDKMSIPTYLLIPKNLVQGSFEVQLELFKLERNKKARLIVNEVPVERKTTSVNLTKHLKFFKQPIIRPKLASPTEHRQEVSVMQNDPNSNYIRIEKKEMNNRGECTRYSIASEYATLVVGDECAISEAIPDNKFNIFRCITGDALTTTLNPRADGVISGQNISIDTVTLIVTDKLNIGVTDAVEITLNYPPSYAAQFQISRSTWSGSSFEKKEVIIPYRDFEGDATLVVDDQVKSGYIYEYFLSYKTTTGEVRQSISKIHQYFKINNKGIAVETSNHTTTLVDGRPNFRFNITSTRSYVSDKIGLIAANTPGVSIEINPNTGLDKLDDIVYHKVARINLKNGVRESFSDLTSNSSMGNSQSEYYLNDDMSNRRMHGIEDLDVMTDYLYEVRTYARNPATMIKGLVHLVNLPHHGGAPPSTFSYKPHKWRQPSYLESGTIPAIDEQDNMIMKKIDEDGEIGVTATYLLTGMNKLYTINSLTAERIDANKIRLHWSLTGNLSEFDHFVVVKETNSTRQLLGAFIGQELLDFLGPADVGTIIYYVIPVLYDFSVGTALRSNAVIVDPEELYFKFRPVDRTDVFTPGPA